MSTTTSEPDLLIGKLERPKDVEIRCMLRQWQDETIADFRTFVYLKKAGEIIPTQRGFTLALEQLEELAEIVQEMIAARDGAPCPTRRGVSVSVEQLSEAREGRRRTAGDR
jgi:hypothetical protein